MITNPKPTIQHIANGGDFYFRFREIDVLRNGTLIKKLTDDNCGDSSSTFRKGGSGGGIIATLDFDEEGMAAMQRLGVFRGMESGFDLYLLGPWRWIANNGPIWVIAYDVNAGGIDKFIIAGGDSREAINVQIHTSDGFIVQLGNVLNYHTT